VLGGAPSAEHRNTRGSHFFFGVVVVPVVVVGVVVLVVVVGVGAT
jgi:hypothetical protein